MELVRRGKTLSVLLVSAGLILLIAGSSIYVEHYLFSGMILFGIGCLLLGSGIYRSIGPYQALAAILFGLLFIYLGFTVHGGFQ